MKLRSFGDTESTLKDQSKLEGGNVRASDLDRTRVAAELQVHCVEGRISVEELERRIEEAMSAQTIHELAATVVDLPAVSVPDQQRHRPQRVRLGPPGSRPFTRRIIVPAQVKRVRTIALDTIAPALNGFGYELERLTPMDLRFVRSSRPGGLVGLFAREKKEQIVISFESKGSTATTMIVHGRASRRVRKAFATLSFT